MKWTQTIFFYHQTIDMDDLHCFIGLSRRPRYFSYGYFPG